MQEFGLEIPEEVSAPMTSADVRYLVLPMP